MAVTCKNCGGAHAIWECKRPATKVPAVTEALRSTRMANVGSGGGTKSSDGRAAEPATKDRRSTASLKEVTAFRETVRTDKAVEPLSGYTSQAGTQALPVDTNSPPGLATGFSTTSAGTVGEKDRQPKFDKKAWSRSYMKIWMRNKRAKLKATTGA